jgi:hypothetical protein
MQENPVGQNSVQASAYAIKKLVNLRVSDDERRAAPGEHPQIGGNLMQRSRYKNPTNQFGVSALKKVPPAPAGEGFADLKNPIRPRLVHGTDFH